MPPSTRATAGTGLPQAGRAPGHERAAIAAVASGIGGAAVSLLRLSGENCHELLAACVPRLVPWTERTLKLCRIVDPATGDVLDQALVVLFCGPRSFTGEDSAEIHCHGGPYIVRRVLGALLGAGFRAAEPGEFTRRAFLNGKVDLTEAEGIRELVDAQSHQQWLAARHLATGRLRGVIEGLRRQLIETLAYLEAQIDFPDEGDTAHLDLTQVTSRAEVVRREVHRLIASYDSGRVASRGLMVALIGAPNAGKSTLLNELLGRERAIVTPVAGTTRDWLEENCLVEGRLLRLFDMAGLRDDPDPIEALGVEAARRLAKEADLVIFLAPADGDDETLRRIAAWQHELQPRSELTVVTKADLGLPTWGAALPQLSCASGSGVAAFRSLLAQKVDAHLGGTKEESFVTSARHVAALEAAAAGLEAFFAAAARQDFVECLAFELQQTVQALRAIIGEVGTEDVLDKIFSEFCLGK